MKQYKRFWLVLSLCLLLLGCNPNHVSVNNTHESPEEIDLLTPTIHGGTPEPLCEWNSTYRVGLTEFNSSVSQCKLFFYAAIIIVNNPDESEKWLQVIIQPKKPFTLTEDGFVDQTTMNQITPYWYRWVIKNSQGQVERAWLAYFIEGRDGLYHTIVTQSEQDWRNSYLEVFFEDVNNDGVREDVTYEIAVGDFLSKVMNP